MRVFESVEHIDKEYTGKHWTGFYHEGLHIINIFEVNIRFFVDNYFMHIPQIHIIIQSITRLRMLSKYEGTSDRIVA